MALSLAAVKSAIKPAALMQGVKTFGPPAAGFVVGYWAAGEVAARLSRFGKQVAVTLPDGTAGAAVDPYLPAWAVPVVVGVLALVGGGFSSRARNKWVKAGGYGAAAGALAWAGVAGLKAYGATTYPGAKQVAELTTKGPFTKLAGLGEAVGYPVGYLSGAPVSIEMAGAPVTIQEVRRLGALPVQIDPARVYSMNPMARRQAATL